MSSLNAILIDDEEKSCQVLDWKIKKYCENVKILKHCHSGRDGINAINELNPDLVFLDIQMPDMNGFEVLQSFDTVNFKTIFVTAHDEYALKAFKYSAVDFLLKPVESSDLVAAVEKIEKERGRTSITDNYELLIDTFNRLKSHENIKRIAFPSLNEIIVLNLDDIIYCEGDSNYTNIYLAGKEKLCLSKTLKLLENFLPEEHFFRIHNTHIVNINRIVKISKRDSGYVMMDNGKEIAISRSRKDDFYKKINLLKG